MHEETDPEGLEPTQAFELLQQDPRALLIDVRSTMEYLFVGHPAGAVHIAWIDEPDWTAHPDHFVTEVRKLMLGGAVCDDPASCAPLVLICRSGKRSLEAGRVLRRAGLEPVFHVLQGFEGGLDDHHHRNTLGGWRYEGLPWEQC